MKDKTGKVSAVIPAGGVGKRFGGDKKKQFYMINGKPVIYYTIKKLSSSYDFEEIIVGADREEFGVLSSVFSELEITNYVLTEKGEERFDTVCNGIQKAGSDYILIHDAVRPCVEAFVVKDVISMAFRSGAAVCGIKPADTVKSVRDGKVVETKDRNTLLITHTPQCFQREILQKALDYIQENRIFVTDDSSAVEFAGWDVDVVESNIENIKITTKHDFVYLQNFIENI